MELRKVALIIPFNEKFEILFQNRKNISKKHNKDYGFFGGGLEEGESVEEALAREIKEELSIDADKLENLKFFKKYYYEKPELDIARELHVFLCKMPETEEIDIKEGEGEVVRIKTAMDYYISDMDRQILQEVLDYLENLNS